MARVCVMKEEIDQVNHILGLLKTFETLANLRDRYSNGSTTISVNGNCGRDHYTTELQDLGGPNHPGKFEQQIAYEIANIIGDATKNAINDVIEMLRSKMPFDVQA
jgi:hypothetical protein